MASDVVGFMSVPFKPRYLHYLYTKKTGLSNAVCIKISGFTRTKHYGMSSCEICILTMFVLGCPEEMSNFNGQVVLLEVLTINLIF